MSDLADFFFHFALYLAEGYCIQYLFRAFITPRRGNLPLCESAAGIFWVVSQSVCGIILPKFFSSVFVNLPLYFSLLLLFSLFWYRGGFLLKLFLVVQFTAIHELCTWAGNSLLWFNSVLANILVDAALRQAISLETFHVALKILSGAFMLFIGFIREAMTVFFIRRIVKSYRQKQRFERDVIYYLLPAAGGVLTASLVRLLMVTLENGYTVTLYESHPMAYLLLPLIALTLLVSNVFSFETYQRMLEAGQERTEKAILENQIAGLKNSLAETERQHESIRAIKHDMTNHMVVLKRLLDEGDGEKIREYFESLSAAVEQPDNQIRTGNMVCDAVINSKFQYAGNAIKGIRLTADGFLLREGTPVKDYDIGVILSNGLDNAIEACERLQTKFPGTDTYITVRSFMKKGMLFIEIENSFDGILEINGETGLPRSTKPDGETHGIGLKNIRNCAQKYAGDMDCLVRDKAFLLSVMLKTARFSDRIPKENT